MALDSLKVELITSRFNQMLEEFAEISPEIEFRDIVRAIAIRVIANALRRTKAADTQKIRARHEAREFTSMDGKKYKLSNHFPDPVWEKLSARRAASLEVKLRSRGLAKQSWLYLAQDLGGTIDVPAYVPAANFKGQTHPENVSFIERGTGANYALKIINNSPVVQAAGGEQALVFAMAGETRYFFTLLSKGAFATAKSRAAKYPGIYARQLTAAA